MDYEGQKLSENIFYILILGFGIVGWIIGYIHQDFFICVKSWFIGLVLSIIVSLSIAMLTVFQKILLTLKR